MGEILIIISKVMDLKIVQWAMLACITLLLVGNLWFTLKYNGLRLENALLKSTAADLGSALHIQNTELKKLGTEFELKAEAMREANKRASQVALESQKSLKKVLEINWVEGETCNEKVSTIFSIISSNRVNRSKRVR